MAKVKLSVKAECFSANKTKSGSTLIFAIDVQPTEKGQTARTLINFNLPDAKAANDYEVEKQYKITIEEA